jgi:hypothetical protein
LAQITLPITQQRPLELGNHLKIPLTQALTLMFVKPLVPPSPHQLEHGLDLQLQPLTTCGLAVLRELHLWFQPALLIAQLYQAQQH